MELAKKRREVAQRDLEYEEAKFLELQQKLSTLKRKSQVLHE